MAMKLRIVVPPHPLIAHWLTMLRNAKTPAPLFATGLSELGKWLTYEAIRDWLPHRTEKIKTQTKQVEGQVVESNINILAIPINSGGYELWHGAREVLPNSNLCLNGIPKIIEKNAGLLIFIGEISDGETVVKILESLNLLKIEPKRIRIITALACSKGLAKIGGIAPDLNIYCACIDPELSEEGQIIPGIGNPSLRLNTIISSPN